MGQATVDLPDPLDQQSSSPANPGGVDDLLAQLAGDEIDRLLAEADEEATPPASAALAAIDAPVEPIQFDEEEADGSLLGDPIPSTPRLSPTSPLAKLNALADLPPEPEEIATVESMIESAPPAAAAPLSVADTLEEEDGGAVDAETQASLDALVSELEPTSASANEPTTAAPEAIAPAADVHEPATATVGGLLPPGAVEKVLADEAAGLLGTTPPALDEPGTTADERGALAAGVDAELAEVAAKKAAPTPVAEPAMAAAAVAITSSGLDAVLGPDEDDDDAPLPLLLRPLEWLNAPLAAFPASFRDVVGKAAIITAMNAIAVLVYVMFFRK